MDTIHKLTEIFREFPGIGPRQAKRFVYHLLSRNNSHLETLSKLILELKKEIRNCPSCFRFFPIDQSNTNMCAICRDKNRDSASLMIVSRDADYETIEKSHYYNGYYFILGGTVPILEKEPDKKIRSKELIDSVKKRASVGLKEIIIASSLNPEGENTAEYVTKIISPITKEFNIKISGLGRGLSTGTELEYSDSDTIKNALKNRS
jgi:recombination protein RecR